jgi:hypothetical protein
VPLRCRARHSHCAVVSAVLLTATQELEDRLNSLRREKATLQRKVCLRAAVPRCVSPQFHDAFLRSSMMRFSS